MLSLDSFLSTKQARNCPAQSGKVPARGRGLGTGEATAKTLPETRGVLLQKPGKSNEVTTSAVTRSLRLLLPVTQHSSLPAFPKVKRHALESHRSTSTRWRPSRSFCRSFLLFCSTANRSWPAAPSGSQRWCRGVVTTRSTGATFTLERRRPALEWPSLGPTG